VSDLDTLTALKAQLVANHYTHSIPSGKSWYFSYETAIVCFALPPNPYISRFLLGEPNKVIELSRLWAPDGHEPNLLTRAIAYAVGCLRAELDVDHESELKHELAGVATTLADGDAMWDGLCLQRNKPMRLHRSGVVKNGYWESIETVQLLVRFVTCTCGSNLYTTRN
jgi:hypothetical protein